MSNYSLSNYFYDSLYDFISHNIKYENVNWYSESIIDFYLDFITDEFNYVDNIDDIVGKIVNIYKAEIYNIKKEIDKLIRKHRRNITSYKSDDVLYILDYFIMDIRYILDELNSKIESYIIKKYDVE